MTSPVPAAAITPVQLATLKARWLPADSADNGWDDAKITDEWTGNYVTTIRAYWYDRVQETAKYLDLQDQSGTLPITQIHRQAKEMLDYWDAYLGKFGASPTPTVSTTFGKIKKRYHVHGGRPSYSYPNQYSPYEQLD
jgi:hypothetical protein